MGMSPTTENSERRHIAHREGPAFLLGLSLFPVNG